MRGSVLAAVVGLIAAGTPAAAQRPATETGIVSGRVVDSLSKPLAGATVSIDSLPSTVTTDSTGAFRLGGVAAGTHLLWVRKIGIAPEAFHVTVLANRTKVVLARIAGAGVVLPTVRTLAVGQFGKPERLAYTMKYDEFYRRRAQSTAGLFYTHEDLAAMKTADLPAMLRRVPGLTVRQTLDGTQLFFPGCGTDHILIMQNQQRVWPEAGGSSAMGSVPGLGSAQKSDPQADPFEVIGSLHLQNIEAIEVYKTIGSLPIEAANGDYCAEIVIWTR